MPRTDPSFLQDQLTEELMVHASAASERLWERCCDSLTDQRNRLLQEVFDIRKEQDRLERRMEFIKRELSDMEKEAARKEELLTAVMDFLNDVPDRFPPSTC